jgi:AcrR family transcriptional regulator
VEKDGKPLRKTQAERRQEAERRILDAAVDLISRQGIEGMTFEEIGTAAGCSRGLPRHYFGTKEGLLIRLAAEIGANFMTALQTPAFESASGVDRLILYVEAYLKRAQASHNRVARALQLMRAESLIATENLRKAMADANGLALQGIIDVITQGQQSGEIRSDVDPKTYAIYVTGALRGIVGLYLSDTGSMDMDGVGRTFTNALRVDLMPR